MVVSLYADALPELDRGAMIRVTCVTLAVALASLMTVSCSGSHNGNQAKSDGGSGAGSDSGHDALAITRTYAPTWTALHDEIFSRQCAIPFCHGGIAGAPPPFTSPDELVNAPAS